MLGAGPPANADGPLPPHTFARQRPSEREKPPPTLGEQASAQGGFEIDDSLFGSSDDVELDKSNVLMLGPTGASSFLLWVCCCFCPPKSAKEVNKINKSTKTHLDHPATASDFCL